MEQNEIKTVLAKIDKCRNCRQFFRCPEQVQMSIFCPVYDESSTDDPLVYTGKPGLKELSAYVAN